MKTIVARAKTEENMKPVVSVVIPTLNEAGAIAEVLEGVKRFADDILIVDGNSTDGTAKIAKHLGAKVVIQNSSGKGAALREAFSLVDGDIILMMDADGSMKAWEIPLYIKAIASGADVVKGSRFLPGGGSEDLSFVRKFGNLFFLSLVNWLWSADYTDLCYGFGAFRREALNRLQPCLNSTNFEIETEICIKSKKLGLKVVEVPSVELRRYQGKSNLGAIQDGLRILRTIIGEFIRRRNP